MNKLRVFVLAPYVLVILLSVYWACSQSQPNAAPYLAQPEWLGIFLCQTQHVDVPMDLVTPEGLHITNGIKHVVTRYEVGDLHGVAAIRRVP